MSLYTEMLGVRFGPTHTQNHGANQEPHLLALWFCKAQFLYPLAVRWAYPETSQLLLDVTVRVKRQEKTLWVPLLALEENAQPTMVHQRPTVAWVYFALALVLIQGNLAVVVSPNKTLSLGATLIVSPQDKQ